MRIKAHAGRFVRGRHAAENPSLGVPVRGGADAPSRALVVREAAPSFERTALPVGRVDAPFLAQLIATEMQLPQTRAKRRASAEHAAAAYNAARRLASAEGLETV